MDSLDAAIGDTEWVEESLDPEVARPALYPGQTFGQVGVHQDKSGNQGGDEGEQAKRRVDDWDRRGEPPQYN